MKTTKDFLQEFRAYHTNNPAVYELFEGYALDVIERGRTRFSARTIFERIRWYTNIETTGTCYKINDHWVPFYARLFMKDHPEHKGFFQLRPAAADWQTVWPYSGTA